MPTCKGCGAEIIWIKTQAGKNMCLDAKPGKRYVCLPHNNWFMFDSFKPHWATCPQAEQFKKKGA
jgi:hypothetical protein